MDYKLPALLLLLIFGLMACQQPEPEMEAGPDFITEKEYRSEYQRFKLVKVAGPFEIPWSVGFLPDGSYLVTERPGALKHVKNGEITNISGLPEIQARGQGGLMEVLPHPDFENNKTVYLTYSKPDGEGQSATALFRARLDGDQLVDGQNLFVQDRYSQPGRHYGSKLAWGLDGKLFMSIGDRGANPPRAQDLMDHAGTLLRLNEDGTVPADNPFVRRNNVLPEIFSYGHRNIQGLVLNPSNGTIWATEHGPRGGDELNRVEARKNYGWNTITLGFDYRTGGQYPGTEGRRKGGMENPILEFMPTLAPSGLAMVTSDKFPAWKGNLLAGGLRSEKIFRIVLSPDEKEVYHLEELLAGEIGRIREVRESPDGFIYILNNAPYSALYRMEPL